MLWIIYAAFILLISGAIGFHLGRFREAYTEMTGMMAGMTMGMLNGFVLGYAAGAYFSSMFWGNFVGIVLGLVLGVYFGRPGGLMGMMDGGMGGVMGGSMGAMLALMMLFPTYALHWTLVILTVIYVLGMGALVVLIERSAPGHRALHMLAPFFTRAIDAEIEEAEERSRDASPPAYFDDYYAFLGVSQAATKQGITDAYLNILSIADEATIERAERALSTLGDPARRRAYDQHLASFSASGDCCPPSAQERVATAKPTTADQPAVPPRRQRPADAVVSVQATGQRAVSGSGNQNRSRSRAPQRRESPISWIGGVAILVIVATLPAYWLASAARTLPAATANAYTDFGVPLSAEVISDLEARAVAAPVAADGTQTIGLAVNGNNMSYSPNVIKVKLGQPVTLNITHNDGGPDCNLYVGIEKLGAHVFADPGETTPMTFTPDRAGIFQLNCSMHMMNPGYIIVTQ